MADKDSRAIADLPRKQVAVVDGEAIKGGLVGLLIMADGTLSLKLRNDAAVGPELTLVAGTTLIMDISEVHLTGTLTDTDVVGLKA